MRLRQVLGLRRKGSQKGYGNERETPEVELIYFGGVLRYKQFVVKNELPKLLAPGLLHCVDFIGAIILELLIAKTVKTAVVKSIRKFGYKWLDDMTPLNNMLKKTDHTSCVTSREPFR